jgi:predicted NAD/FAD-binding protein
VRLGSAVRQIARDPVGVTIRDASGRSERFDQVVIAAHANQGLAMLEAPSPRERALLGAFAYVRNHAVLHTDVSLMPRRRKAWSSWNYVGEDSGGDGRRLCVTYWMNQLQNLPPEHPLFVTLNPVRAPAEGTLLRTEVYEHPLFDAAATRAQRELWSVQGEQNTWWCGAYFGYCFH